MLKNYIKIAFRNLRKRKEYSFVNIAGLSIGIAAAVLIALYSHNELTYDSFHRNADNLYMVYKERITPTGIQETFDTWVPLKEEIVETYPGVVRAARIYTQNVWMEAEEKRFQENVVYTDPELFKMFSFPLIKGSNENPFPSLQSIIISKDIAVKYFGNEDPVGKIFRLAYERDYVVSGVMEKIPQNSSIQIDMAIMLESAGGYEDVKEMWSSSFLNTYIQIREDATAEELEALFPEFIANIWDEEVASRTNFKLLPVKEMYNKFNDSDKYAYILLGIAVAIVIIACINFMNMATARSLERAREVGMRKVMGSQRFQLVIQFLGESILITVISLIVGIGLAEALLPVFNDLYELELSINLLENTGLLLVLLGLALFIGLVAGSYPALFLSKFASSEVLRGNISRKPGGLTLRRILVSVQFAVTIAIIIGTLIMNRQVQFMKNADLGLQKENIIAIQRSADDFEDEEDANIRLRTFKEEVRKHPEVVSVASSRAIPGQPFGFNSFTFVRPEGWTSDSPLRMRFTHIDSHYFDLFNIPFAEGRNFQTDSEVDREEGVIINKAALEDFGWETAEGKTIRLGSSGDRSLNVVGVVENYHYQSLENVVEPVIHFYRPSENNVHNFISVKIDSDQISSTLEKLEANWARIVAEDMPMDYLFVDEQFNQLYQTQDRLVTVAGAFFIFAIIIASLGLLALASLMVSQRTREIGIRKVMGASVARIIILVSRDYVLLVALGFVVAAPLAYYLMDSWLQDFAYRINMDGGFFLVGGLVTLTIALFTVSIQAFKAARMNPVNSLRNE